MNENTQAHLAAQQTTFIAGLSRASLPISLRRMLATCFGGSSKGGKLQPGIRHPILGDLLSFTSS